MTGILATYRSKVKQMRSPLRQKILIFDLEGLRKVESKIFKSKSSTNNQNLKLIKAKLFHLMITSKEISKILPTLGHSQHA